VTDVVCTRCGGSGPWRFIKFNAAGAIVECARVVDFIVCRRRVQVDDRDMPGVVNAL
jgi:hypothetical protein